MAKSKRTPDVNIIATSIIARTTDEAHVVKNPAAVALHFMYYNFARPHKTLANPYPRTPAMAAGVSDHIWTIEDIVSLAQ